MTVTDQAVEQLNSELQKLDIEETEVEVDVVVEGPAQNLEQYNEKLLKQVQKEGGKRGVEIEGAADMGGLQFFCTSVTSCAGNVELLVESVKAMNAKSKPDEEERKGGAGKVGKIVMSCVDGQLAFVAYVPKGKPCNALEWLTYVVETVVDGKAKVESCATISACEGVDSANWATCLVKNNPDLNVFALKLRDPSISIAYSYLRSRGLFPEDDDEDDDECCYGDDYFPEEDEEEAPAAKETYDNLEPIAERLTTDKMEKKMAKITKEGGKRGVEIEGAADLGGLKFFCTQVLLPEGNLDMLVESMRAMNFKSDPTEEERKGGSGHIGKTIFSMNDDCICLVAYVPEDSQGECSASEWLSHTVTEILNEGNCATQVAADLVQSHAGNEKSFAKAIIQKSPEQGLFPLKMKDRSINAAYGFLKARGLFPDGNDDDDEEDYVFGDDDFP